MHTDAGDSMIITVSLCGRALLQIGVTEESLNISVHDILMEEHVLPLVEEDMRLVASCMIGLLR